MKTFPPNLVPHDDIRQITSMALLEGKVERAEDAYDVLMRAMLHLPDYLEGIQAGKKDAPITLMPLINDLRAARKEGLLTESGDLRSLADAVHLRGLIHLQRRELQLARELFDLLAQFRSLLTCNG